MTFVWPSLLWLLLLSMWSSLILFATRRRLREVAPYATAVLLGFGAFFAALFTLVIRRSESVDDNRRTTALIQTTGYCVAAVGPVVMGWIHGRSGGWVIPFAVVAAGAIPSAASTSPISWSML